MKIKHQRMLNKSLLCELAFKLATDDSLRLLSYADSCGWVRFVSHLSLAQPFRLLLRIVIGWYRILPNGSLVLRLSVYFGLTIGWAMSFLRGFIFQLLFIRI